MDAPNPKRPCHVPSTTSSSQNLAPLPISYDFNQSDVDLTISSFLSLSNLPLFSSPLSIGFSFDRVLEKIITSAAGTSCDKTDQDRFLDRTLQLASLLHKSTKRCIRKRATFQNSISWPLLPELTMKVFSMLDTKSLMHASACCTMFNKCAMDRVCYSHIDLTMPVKSIDNGVVCIMIHRAGKELRSLKLGCIFPPAGGSTTSLLTRSCLAPLSFNHGFAGGLLRSLHLYNLRSMDSKSLSAALSDCSNLIDLKILGLGDNKSTRAVSVIHEKLSLDKTPVRRDLKFTSIVLTTTDSNLVKFVDNCSNLTSLTLLRFLLNDAIAQTILKGFRQLKYMNLSLSPGINGCFLRGLGLSCRDSPLETLILRNCFNLKEREVLLFLNSLLAGDFKSVRHIDVSSIHGLVSDGGNRTFEPKFPIEELRKQRPSVTFVAIFESPPPSSSSSSYLEDTPSGSSNYSSEDEEEEEEEEEEYYDDFE